MTAKPRHKLREESASSVQVGCIVLKNMKRARVQVGVCLGVGGNTGTELAT